MVPLAEIVTVVVVAGTTLRAISARHCCSAIFRLLTTTENRLLPSHRQVPRKL